MSLQSKTPERRLRRGFSTLLLCLMLSVMAAGFLLVLFSFQSIDLRLQSQGENLRVSSQASNNVLALAIAHIAEDRDWGKKGESIHWGGIDGSLARVRFRPSPTNMALGEEVPPVVQVGKAPPQDLTPWDEDLDSINNLGGENSIMAFNGVIVPPNAILVVAVGENRGKQQVAYQIIIGSPQPYSLGSSGPLKVTGDTLVAGLESTLKAVSLGPNPSPDDLEEAGLVSNDNHNDAIVLDGNINIVGDVSTVGQIQKSAQVTIDGEEKPGSQAVTFPMIDFDSYDPEGDPNDPSDDRPTLVKRTESVVTNAIQNPLYGFQRFPGNTSFPDGLKLDGSAVYVAGDLIVDGPLEGTGAIIVRGETHLRGGANLKADMTVAVLSEGDLAVASNAGQTSTFQGLLYSRGDLELSNTRVIGTAIAAGSASGVPSDLIVRDSTVISTPESSDFRIVVKGYPSQQGGGMAGAGMTKSGNGWDLLEPNPADLLIDNQFQFSPDNLKILVRPPGGGPGQIVSNPQEALAAGLSPGELDSLGNAYDELLALWSDRIQELQAQHAQELVDILGFDLNEFLKVSSRLKAKQVFYVD